MAEFWIGQRRYRTKGAAQEAVQEVLYRYNVGSIVDQEDDHQLLLDLLDMHPNADDKIGSGVEAFAIAAPQRGPYPGFEVIRTDGSRIDFSYRECLKPRTYRQQVLNVMRDEVKATISVYFESRKAADSLLSDHSGTPLESTNTAVAYFRGPSFNDIAREFAESHGGWEAIELTSSAEKGLGRFVDRDLAERWFIHHQAHAVLGLLSAEENRRRLRR
ncbi:DCL family protein [Streptomyces europaeiscabiei]|uniref:DCL family protein n=1 Tax=Streptomyces europaeiscabiei TaxID=146819 RepID=A0ABU4NRL3_9ACTN|nr:DCL family protein [Streptomyces europaeiscabiei]MDX2526210.1 DCL family protein [Streptomyces europaeiscabiei]MDX2762908.1 DCL family protein [Streptomyces europaeiscabiei]MDX2768001.1 DCL family protein [Streptomyces europaeiscabiei]MDX3547529.1 DCL family protein [Streptomyces europaeiscabiei]MDX3557006.1 DCL family protein [Streptomyces europaeiscabiei]